MTNGFLGQIPTEITICLTPETSQDDVPIDRGNIIVGSSHWGCWDDGYLDGRTVPFYMRILKVDWSYSSSCARYYDVKDSLIIYFIDLLTTVFMFCLSVQGSLFSTLVRCTSFELLPWILWCHK